MLGTRKQTAKITNHRITPAIRDEIIERVNEARNLGLRMDEQLRFENCFYRLKVSYNIRNDLNVDVSIKL